MKTLKRISLFISIVWRPVTGDMGDTYFQAWRKYRMSADTAWDISKTLIK
jgi:hypothetical protein